MDLFWTAVMFCFGIGLLVKGSDWLVDSAARIGKQFGLSNFIIGLTIVAIGTSLPELATAITASFYGDSNIIIGTIIGSNIANLALIVGLAAIMVPIALKKDIYRRDGTIMFIVTLLFYFFCLDGILTPWEGGFFLFIFSSYIFYFITTKRRYKKEFHFKNYLEEYSDVKGKEKFDTVPEITKNIKKAFRQHLFEKMSLLLENFSDTAKKIRNSLRRNWKKAVEKKAAFFYLFKQLGIILIGAACIFFGANLIITSALKLPFSQLAIGAVFVAIGTSLPELAITISSLRKGLPQIMIGNLVGSNIANVLLVGGFAAVINPIIVPISKVQLSFVFLLLITWLFLVFLRNDSKITRIEAITLLLLYIAFVASSFGLKLGI